MANKSKYNFNEVERKFDIIRDDKGTDKVLLGDGTYGESPLSVKLTKVENEINIERARIDNLTQLEDGSTTGDAELQDIRIGADSKTYTSAGESVRTQFTRVNDDVKDVAYDIYNLYEISENRMHWSYDDVTQNAYLENDGIVTEYADWWISTFLEVEPSTEYVYIKNWTDKSLADNVYYNLFDVNKNFISGANGEIITTTANTSYIKISTKSSYFNGGATLIKKELYDAGLSNFEPYSKTFKETKDLNIAVSQLLTDVENINLNINKIQPLTETLGKYAQPNYDKNIRAIQRIGEVGDLPHHSIPAFVKAYKIGFRILLCDLMFTKDNVGVCFHDEYLNKNYKDVCNSDGTKVSTDTPIYIKEHTYDELSVYDYGLYKGEEFRDYSLLKFTDMLKLVKNLGVELYIEIKEMTQEQSIIAFNLIKIYGLEKSVTWCGTKKHLSYIVSLDEKARLGVIPSTLDINSINTILTLKTDKNEVFVFGWNTWELTDELVNLMIEKKIGYEIGTINTLDEIINYFNQGELYNYCTGIESNTIIAGKAILENILINQ